MSKRTVPAKGGATPAKGQPIPFDPLVEIGAKMATVAKAIERVQQASHDLPEDSRAKHHNQQEDMALQDYHDALEEMALSVPATSLAGCMVQLAVMMGRFHEREASKEYSYSDFQNKQIERRVEFGFESILSVLEGESGVDRKTVGADYYASTHEQLPARVEAELMAEGGAEC
jgi:hypothetical protein